MLITPLKLRRTSIMQESEVRVDALEFIIKYKHGRRKMTERHTISYYSKSDGKRLMRPYDPNSDMQYEFTAKSTGNVCKRYWDVSKNGWRTAKSRWKISPVKK